MCHHYYDASLIEIIQILYDDTFILCIQCVGRFVQKNVARVLIHRTGYQDTLLLSLAQPHSVPTYLSIELQRQPHDVVVEVGYFGSPLQAFLVYLPVVHFGRYFPQKYLIIRHIARFSVNIKTGNVWHVKIIKSDSV